MDHIEDFGESQVMRPAGELAKALIGTENSLYPNKPQIISRNYALVD